MRKKDRRGSFPLLGFLLAGPMTGYELKKEIDRTVAYFWSEGFGSIYPSLREFVAEGFIAEAKETTPGYQKNRPYVLLESGRTAFMEWLRSPLESFELRRNELLIKLFFSSYLTDAEMLAFVGTYKRIHASQLQAYLLLRSEIASASAASKERLGWLSGVDHGIALSQSLVGWCESLERAITEGSGYE